MKRKFWILLLLVLAALAGAPFLKADRFGPRIRSGLENALGRKVEIGAVRLHLLTGPGFSVRKVVIHERPEFSAEPFAYVDNLVVRIRLLGLLSGKLEFSSLRLDKPHVNLMRQADGAWNVQALLAPQTAAPGGGSGAPMPELEVRRGRLNFKIDDRKSAYYFTDADIDFSSVGDGNFDIWFVGEMARTDRMARGLGRVTARGRLRDTGGEPKLNLDAQLERSALQELAQLVGPRDLGVHGVVKSRAEISGPVSALAIKGQLDLTELHHWTQPPRAAASSVGYTGRLELGAQSLRLETDAKRPLRAKVTLDKYLTAPRWQVEAVAEALSLNDMAEWLRPPGAEFNGMKLAGTLDGRVTASNDMAANGAATLTALDWTWGEGSRLEAAKLEAEWSEGAVRLAPATLELDGQPLQVECDWALSAPSWECKGASKGHDVRKLGRWMKALGLRAAWVEDLTAGQLRGALAVGQTGMDSPQWKGQLELRNAELPVPELAAPVKIAAATVVWQQERLSMPTMRASAGGLNWAGAYRYDVGATRPHRLTIDADLLAIAELEKVLGPMWRGTGFLSRAIGLGEKVDSGAAEIDLRAKRLGIVENFRAMVWREGEKLTIQGLSGEWRGGKLTGEGVARLGGDVEMTGKVAGVAWEGGVVESDWKLTGRGRVNVAGKARLTGGLAEIISGGYQWSSNGRLQVSGVEGLFDGRKVAGKVTGSGEGPVLIEFGELLKLRAVVTPFAVTVEGR
ncbi:MAG: AsmA family protein [Bryobacterales bacterium]|nr:AsmA family protein [Bryobacterales bacterium]